MPTIHRFWAGPKEMPEEYAYFGEQWGYLNPDWDVRMWGEDDIEEFSSVLPVIQDLYDRDAGRHGIELYVQVADVMGYAIIQRYGGAYFNTDLEPVQPLNGLPAGAWASYENNVDGRVVNAAIGAYRPNNVFWTRLLHQLNDNYFEHRLDEMIEATGPAYLTRQAQAHPDELHVFGTNVFNPVHWSSIERGGDASAFLSNLPEETIAVHHWGHRKDGRSNTVEVATQYE